MHAWRDAQRVHVYPPSLILGLPDRAVPVEVCDRCGQERHRNGNDTGWVVRFETATGIRRALFLDREGGSTPCSPFVRSP